MVYQICRPCGTREVCTMMQLGAQLFTLRDYTQPAKDFAYSMGQVA